MRRALSVLVLVVLAGLLGANLAAGAASPNDTTCRKLMKSTSSPSNADLLKYSTCRFDKLDAAVQGLQPPVTPGSPASSTSPRPTSTAPASPGPTTTAPTTTAPTTTAPTTAAFPTDATTGVPAGITLTDYTGPATIKTAGTVIDGKRITSCLVVEARDVTIRNSLVQSKACFFNVLVTDPEARLQLVDVEIDGLGNGSGDSAVSGAGYTCLRCDVHGTVDGFKVGSKVTVKDSYIHDLVGTSDSHNDGMQLMSGTGVRIEHNAILIGLRTATSGILVKADFGPVSDVVIDRNLVGGGAWSIYAGSEEGNGGDGPATRVTVTGNQFTTRYFAKGGAFGPLTDLMPSYTVAGNVWADGANQGRTVS